MNKIETKEGRKSLLEVTHDIFIVPKGQEHLVHYTAEIVHRDPKTGRRTSEPQLRRCSLRLFDTIVKRNLELQGWVLNILHHPLGKYIAYEPEIDKDAKIAELEAKLAGAKDAQAKVAELEAELAKQAGDADKDALAVKDAEIARLKAQLAKAEKSSKKAK